MKVIEMIPGMEFHRPMPMDNSGSTGLVESIFVAQTQHPLYPALQLVVWKFIHHPFGLEWSHDALSPMQDVGYPEPFSQDRLLANLRKALVPNA